MICLKKKKTPPSPNPRAFFGCELKKQYAQNPWHPMSHQARFCVCVCVFYYCTRDLGRVTVNTRLVNSHQQEQTGWCLFAFLPRLYFCLCSGVSSHACVCEIYTISPCRYLRFHRQLKLALKHSSSFVSTEKPPFWTACKPTAVSHLWVPLAKDSRDYGL